MVDLTIFHPRLKKGNRNRPIMLYIGPIIRQRNLDAFLNVPIKGLKRLVGLGEYRDALAKRYPYAEFIDPLEPKRLAEIMAQADVFVYPCSDCRLEECLIQALASGLPIAGFATDLLSKVVDQPSLGSVGSCLELAIRRALDEKEVEARVRRAKELNSYIGMIMKSDL